MGRFELQLSPVPTRRADTPRQQPADLAGRLVCFLDEVKLLSPRLAGDLRSLLAAQVVAPTLEDGPLAAHHGKIFVGQLILQGKGRCGDYHLLAGHHAWNQIGQRLTSTRASLDDEMVPAGYGLLSRLCHRQLTRADLATTGKSGHDARQGL